MEQLLFLALLGVVGLLRWLSQRAEERRNREAETRTGQPPPNVPVPRAPAQTEEERIRRFMEALGVPTSNAPIPKAPPRAEAPKPKPTAAPRKHAMPVDPFPVPRGGLPVPPMVTPPPLPRQSAPVSPPPSLPPTAPPLPTRETSVFADSGARSATAARSAAEFEVRDVAEAAYEAVEPAGADARRGSARGMRASGSLAARLASAEGLREAIILREIFGPPRSMQPLGFRPD